MTYREQHILLALVAHIRGLRAGGPQAKVVPSLTQIEAMIRELDPNGMQELPSQEEPASIGAGNE